MFSLKTLKRQIINEINKNLPPQSKLAAEILEYPPNPEWGDIALPCFKIIQEYRNKIIQELKNKLQSFVAKNPYIKEVKVAGSYLNFVLDKEKIAKEILIRPIGLIGPIRPIRPIVTEYVSPNSNKPLHLGHVKNGLVGEAICNILEKTGNKVIRTCLVNDRGIHIAKSMLAYLKFGANKTPQKTGEKGDALVGRYYTLYGQKLRENPELEKEAYELLKKWERGDKKTIALWKKMTNWVLEGFEETYKKLGVRFDKTYFESQIYKEGKKMVLKYLKEKKFQKDKKGNVIALLEKYDLPNKVVLRSDGTAVYATTDIILAYKRAKDFHFDQLIYIVASEQNLYFKQLFKIFEMLKAPFAKKLKHLNHGLILLPEGKLKSREGTKVDADDLIKKLEEMTTIEAKKRHHDAIERQLKKRSEILALAALKFYILQVDPKADTLFKPEESISLTGKTGVYIEYAYARIHSILKKTKNQKPKTKNFISPISLPRSEPQVLLRGPIGPISPIEKKLIMHLIKYEETLESAAKNLDPSYLTNYLYELAEKFNDFYEKEPVLKAPEPTRTKRILLIKKIAEVLKEGMEILGMKPLKQV